MELILKRVLFTDDGTLGVLICGNHPVCVTLEENWRDNAKGISCIPEGQYLCQRVDTPHHGITYQVMNVPGRSAILFHSGNSEKDTEGCILVGMEYGEVKATDDQTKQTEDQLAVLRSKEAFERFMELMGGRENGRSTFALRIKNC